MTQQINRRTRALVNDKRADTATTKRPSVGREAKLATALRDNLRRRKTAARSLLQSEKPRETPASGADQDR